MTRALLRGLVLDELRKLPAALARSWLNPCGRLAWAVFWREVRSARKQWWRAAFWTSRAAALDQECIELRGAGTCAADVARRAARLALAMEGIVTDGC